MPTQQETHPIVKLIKQGLNFPKYFIQGRMQTPTTTLNDLQPGEGAIVDVNGQKVAAFKKSDQEVVMLSPVCKHAGCIVGWNQQDKTWDCPCHGSRYSNVGKVIHGPSEEDLDQK